MREREIRGVMSDRNSRKKDGVHTNRNRDQETVETRRVREGRERVGGDVVVCVSVVGDVANLKAPDKFFPILANSCVGRRGSDLVVSEGSSIKFKSPQTKVGIPASIAERDSISRELNGKSPPDLR